MGASITLPQDRIFSIAHLLAATELYTVVRTDGTVEDGWSVSGDSHRCSAFIPTIAAAAGRISSTESWRVLMTNGKPDEDSAHACGWRRVETVWPTRITNEAERADWRAKFIICLKENDHQRMYRAISAAQYAGVPNEALRAEFNAVVDAEVEEDLKLQGAGKTPPFRSPFGMSPKEVEGRLRT